MKPKAFLCDIDGTIAHRGDRSPYDLTIVDQDTVDATMAIIITCLYRCGYTIVFTSGREETARELTHAWLLRHIDIMDFDLMMRVTGDDRQDAVVKKEMLDAAAAAYDIIGAFDDRNRVVDMWRANGIKTLQVCSREEGEF
jgi:LNS2 (Lipin/Ned1/Smp2).